MLIHNITQLPHSRKNLAKAFGGKADECNLIERMKDKFKHVRKPCRYSISSITNPAVKVVAEILAGKIMKKCRTDKVPTLIVSLAS